MLILDFINVGNGNSILIREAEGGEQRFAMLVDCGYDCLVRSDHPLYSNPRSRRIYAGDFLKKENVRHLDMLLLTHFHRDHIGGLSRVLEAAEVSVLLTTYLPPGNAAPINLNADGELPKSARNIPLCMELYASALREHGDKIKDVEILSGRHTEVKTLTPELKMDILFGEPALYPRQKEVYDGVFDGERDVYAMLHWAKSINISSLRQRLYYRGREIVLAGDAYAFLWDSTALAPCDILQVPHHGTLDSTTRKMLKLLRPKTAVVCAAAERPDEKPHPYIVSLLKEYVPDVRFTDAVDIPGLTEPEYHESVRIELD